MLAETDRLVEVRRVYFHGGDEDSDCIDFEPGSCFAVIMDEPTASDGMAAGHFDTEIVLLTETVKEQFNALWGQGSFSFEPEGDDHGGWWLGVADIHNVRDDVDAQVRALVALLGSPVILPEPVRGSNS